MAESRRPTPREILLRALGRPPEERPSLLDEECQGDAELRQRMETILTSLDEVVAEVDASAATSTSAFSAPSGFSNLDNVKAVSDPDWADTLDIVEAIGTGLKSGMRVDRYRLLQRIGTGGFGSVWMAEQEEPVRRKVALKVIKLGMDTREVIARFEAERQALAMMDHPNIAKVFDAGVTDRGRPYFVMELVRGVTVTDYCDTQNLQVSERLEIFIAICHALQHAHQKGVIHRDIKPSNVLVTLHDGQPVPKVIDFGVAKATNARLTERTLFTRFHQMIGTPVYMSPEQAELSGLDVDTRSDIFSLGVLLYELLTGTTPFDPETLASPDVTEIKRMIREHEPPRPSTRLSHLKDDRATDVAKRRHSSPAALKSELRGDLDCIVMKAMEKDRTRRYGTASEFAADIQRFLRDEPVLAQPPTWGYRLRKTLRRHRGLVGAATAVVLSLVAGLIVSLALYFRVDTLFHNSERLRREAEDARATVTRQKSELEDSLAREHAALKAKSAAFEVKERALARARSLYLTTKAAIAMTTDPSVALLLVLAAEELHPGTLLADLDFVLEILENLKERRTLFGHRNAVRSVDVSSDGRWLASGSVDGTAKIWDRLRGREVWSLSHGAPVYSVSFSADGTLLVTGAQDHTVRVWRRDTADHIRVLQCEGVVRAAEFDPAGRRIVVGSEDRTASIWDVATGQQEILLIGHTDTVYSATFSPDGQWVATGSLDGTARVWDAASGAQHTVFTGAGRIGPVAFTPDGKSVVSAGSSGRPRLWRREDGRESAQFEDAASPLYSLDFTRDGRFLIGGLKSGTVGVWEVESGRIVEQLRGHWGTVNFVRCSPRGDQIVSASSDKTVRIWDLRRTRRFPVFDNKLAWKGRFSPDGQRIVTACACSTASVWDVHTGEKLVTLAGHETPNVETAVFSVDGLTILTTSSDQTARVWDSTTGRELARLVGHSAWIIGGSFSPDGQTVLTASFDKTARLWDTKKGEERTKLQHRDRVISAVFSPNGLRVLTASTDKTARVWDARSGEEVLQLGGHTKEVAVAMYSPDGRRILTAAFDRTARIWDAESGRPLVEISNVHVMKLNYDTERYRILSSVQFSPDGRRVLTAQYGLSLAIWDTENGARLQTLTGHEGFALWAEFSPDGRRVATGGYDDTVRVWETETGEEIVRYPVDDDVKSVSFSPDGQLLFIAPSYHNPLIVPADPRQYAEASQPRRLTPQEQREFKAVSDEESVAYQSEWEFEHEQAAFGDTCEAILAGQEDVRLLDRFARQAAQVLRRLRAHSDPEVAREILRSAVAALRRLAQNWPELAAALPAEAAEAAIPTVRSGVEFLERRFEERHSRPELSSFAAVDDALAKTSLVHVGDVWRMFLGHKEPSPDLEWIEAGFDDGAWLEGRTGFRHAINAAESPGGEPSTTVESPGSIFYMRRKFSVPDRKKYRRFQLVVRSERGYVAFVNGREVSRNALGATGQRIPHDWEVKDEWTPARTTAIDVTDIIREGENVLALQGASNALSRDGVSLVPELVAERNLDAGAMQAEFERMRGLIRGDDREDLVAYIDARRRQIAGDLDGALVEFAKLIDKHPRVPEPLAAWVACQRGLGRIQAAADRLSSVLAGPRRAPPEILALWLTVERVDLGRGWGEIVRKWPRRAPVMTGRLVVGAGQRWKFTTSKPADGWQAADFEDATWSQGPAPFGDRPNPSAHVATPWKSQEIWLRHTSVMERVQYPEYLQVGLRLRVRHDDDVRVFIDGEPAVGFSGWLDRYRVVWLDLPEFFDGEKHTIAVHCVNRGGGQFLDVVAEEVLAVR